jgi:hypothetical protein
MAETKTGAPRSSAPKAKETGSRAEARPKEPKEPKEPSASAEHGHVCNVAFCPIGLALSTVQGAAPEVLEHLLKAAQEFFLAARAVMDNRAGDFQEPSDEASIERIEIS